MLKGSCLCARVQFDILQTPTEPTACHCRQCRKQTGHCLVSAEVPKSAVVVTTGTDHLRWYSSSENVRRGFCATCGSTLFWEPLLRDWTSVALGAIDGDTELQLKRHIFVSQKGDYYGLDDGLPQNDR